MSLEANRIGRYKRIGIVVMWAASLVLASVWAQSQTIPGNAVAQTIISGNDIGFRVDERVGDVIAGTLVVRINGEWFVTGPARTLRTVPPAVK